MRNYGLIITTALVAVGEVHAGAVNEKMRRVTKALRGGINQVSVTVCEVNDHLITCLTAHELPASEETTSRPRFDQ